MRSLFLAPVLMLGGLASIASAAPDSGPQTVDMVTSEALIPPTSTPHQIHLGKVRIDYTATFSETPLFDSQGNLQASISATSYVMDGVRDPSRRPVAFLFNGGPGASSTPLHFGAFGPRHNERDASGARQLADNPGSLIDDADLIFIDPVGTGFSRERPGVVSGAYWSPVTDAAAALKLIRQWLTDNHRQQSPLFIIGESYGGFRIAMMMQHAQDLPIAGLILISPMLDASGSSGEVGNDQAYIFDLPSMAVAAWEHQKIGRRTGTLEAYYEQARQFAQSDYALALQKGSTIASSERDRIAQTVAAFIGLPVESVVDTNLRVDSQYFLEHLLAADGKLVGRLDTRITAPLAAPVANPDRPSAANDPALGLGATNVIKSDLARDYYQHDLKVKTQRDYLSLTLDVNFRWNWADAMYAKGPKELQLYINPTPNIAAVMSKQSKMRLMLVGGYYDLAVPLLAPRYALWHAGVPMDRVTLLAMPSGHSPFEGDDNLRRGSEAVHEFLRATN